MKWTSKLLSLLLIFLPLAAAGLIHFAPQAQVIKDAGEKAAEAEKAGNWSIAVTNLQTILDWEDWRADALEQLGRAEYELKQYEAAASAFDKARNASELSFDNIERLGLAYMQIGRAGDAQELWRAISLSAPADFDFLMETASKQREIGDMVGTVNTLLNAYHLREGDIEVNYLLGVQLAVTEPQNAVKFLTVSSTAGGSREAVSKELLTEIENSEETDMLRSLRVGQILSNAGEWDLAARSFDEVVNAFPQNGFAWALLGEALQHSGGSGFEELQKALSLDPKSDMVNALMALYYRRQNKTEMAIDYLKKAITANPKEAAWQIELGNTYAEAGNLQSALDAYSEATKVEPEDPTAWQALASFCFSRNIEISPTGIDAARKALSLDPKNPELLDLMGVGLLINDDPDSAERFFSQAVELAPENATYHLHYGQLYIQKGDCARASTELKEAITLAQDDARISSNAERLLSGYCAGY